MNIVILDAATLGDDTDLTPINEIGTVTIYPFTAPAEVAARIETAEIVLINKVRLDESNLSAAKSLRFIGVFATGYDNIDLACCRSRGIAVCNVPGYSAQSVAQLTAAMVLSLSTHLPEYRRCVHSGQYTAEGVANRLTPVWHELAGRTWAIIGCGSIGSQTAKVAEALGCRVLPFRRGGDLDAVLSQADIVSVHLPLNDQTRGLISREKIALMKHDAIFVNLARGAVADEAALAEAIESGTLGGLGIDVYTAEPFGPEHPYSRLLSRDNVILTPHCGWGSLEARNRCVRIAADNIRAFLENRTKNRVDCA